MTRKHKKTDITTTIITNQLKKATHKFTKDKTLVFVILREKMKKAKSNTNFNPNCNPKLTLAPGQWKTGVV